MIIYRKKIEYRLIEMKIITDSNCKKVGWGSIPHHKIDYITKETTHDAIVIGSDGVKFIK